MPPTYSIPRLDDPSFPTAHSSPAVGVDTEMPPKTLWLLAPSPDSARSVARGSIPEGYSLIPVESFVINPTPQYTQSDSTQVWVYGASFAGAFVLVIVLCKIVHMCFRREKRPADPVTKLESHGSEISPSPSSSTPAGASTATPIITPPRPRPLPAWDPPPAPKRERVLQFEGLSLYGIPQGPKLDVPMLMGVLSYHRGPTIPTFNSSPSEPGPYRTSIDNESSTKSSIKRSLTPASGDEAASVAETCQTSDYLGDTQREATINQKLELGLANAKGKVHEGEDKVEPKLPLLAMEETASLDMVTGEENKFDNEERSADTIDNEYPSINEVTSVNDGGFGFKDFSLKESSVNLQQEYTAIFSEPSTVEVRLDAFQDEEEDEEVPVPLNLHMWIGSTNTGACAGSERDYDDADSFNLANVVLRAPVAIERASFVKGLDVVVPVECQVEHVQRETDREAEIVEMVGIPSMWRFEETVAAPSASRVPRVAQQAVDNYLMDLVRIKKANDVAFLEGVVSNRECRKDSFESSVAKAIVPDTAVGLFTSVFDGESKGKGSINVEGSRGLGLVAKPTSSLDCERDAPYPVTELVGIKRIHDGGNTSSHPMKILHGAIVDSRAMFSQPTKHFDQPFLDSLMDLTRIKRLDEVVGNIASGQPRSILDKKGKGRMANSRSFEATPLIGEFAHAFQNSIRDLIQDEHVEVDVCVGMSKSVSFASVVLKSRGSNSSVCSMTYMTRIQHGRRWDEPAMDASGRSVHISSVDEDLTKTTHSLGSAVGVSETFNARSHVHTDFVTDLLQIKKVGVHDGSGLAQPVFSSSGSQNVISGTMDLNSQSTLSFHLLSDSEDEIDFDDDFSDSDSEEMEDDEPRRFESFGTGDRREAFKRRLWGVYQRRYGGEVGKARMAMRTWGSLRFLMKKYGGERHTEFVVKSTGEADVDGKSCANDVTGLKEDGDDRDVRGVSMGMDVSAVAPPGLNAPDAVSTKDMKNKKRERTLTSVTNPRSKGDDGSVSEERDHHRLTHGQRTSRVVAGKRVSSLARSRKTHSKTKQGVAGLGIRASVSSLGSCTDNIVGKCAGDDDRRCNSATSTLESIKRLGSNKEEWDKGVKCNEFNGYASGRTGGYRSTLPYSAQRTHTMKRAWTRWRPARTVQNPGPSDCSVHSMYEDDSKGKRLSKSEWNSSRALNTGTTGSRIERACIIGDADYFSGLTRPISLTAGTSETCKKENPATNDTRDKENTKAGLSRTSSLLGKLKKGYSSSLLPAGTGIGSKSGGGDFTSSGALALKRVLAAPRRAFHSVINFGPHSTGSPAALKNSK